MDAQYKPNIITSELLDAIMSNEVLIDALSEGSENELVVINNDCNMKCENMPIQIKAILSDVKLFIGSSGATDISISKLENNHNEAVDKLYKTLIFKYLKDNEHTIQTLELKNEYKEKVKEFLAIHKDLSSKMYDVITDLVNLYIKIDKLRKKLFEAEREKNTLKTMLAEKENTLRILHRVKASNSNRAYKYLAAARKQIYETKKQLSAKELSIKNKKVHLHHIDNLIGKTEIRLFCLLDSMNELSIEI